MRLIFDENMPYAFAHELVGHECVSVTRLGWRGTENGELLTRAELAGFDVLVTLDDDMRSEQKMDGRRIDLVIVRPSEQGKIALKSLAGQVLIALAAITPGQLCIITPTGIDG